MTTHALDFARAEFVISMPRYKHGPQVDLPLVVVAGRSNVGKSSFINRLTGKKNLARTSRTPGRTQLLNFFRIGDSLMLADVPGYGFAEAPPGEVKRWTQNVGDFIRTAPNILAVILLLDIRRDPSADDLNFINLVHSSKARLLIAATKCDKFSRSASFKRRSEIAKRLGISPDQILITSSKDDEGFDLARQTITSLMEPPPIDVVAIDGPSGAGKSTIAKKLALALGWRYLDTGAMYRAVGLKAHRLGIDFCDDAALEEMLENTVVEFRDGVETARIFLDGEDVSEAIRQHMVSDLASRVSARKPVRTAMARFQRQIGEAGPTVAEGRDMGTVVFPDAALKVFMTASPQTRAKRRTEELLQRGQPADFDTILNDIIKRDEQDSTREHAPLATAKNAFVLDTSDLTVDEVVSSIAQKLASNRQAHG